MVSFPTEKVYDSNGLSGLPCLVYIFNVYQRLLSRNLSRSWVARSSRTFQKQGQTSRCLELRASSIWQYDLAMEPVHVNYSMVPSKHRGLFNCQHLLRIPHSYLHIMPLAVSQTDQSLVTSHPIIVSQPLTPSLRERSFCSIAPSPKSDNPVVLACGPVLLMIQNSTNLITSSVTRISHQPTASIRTE
jgi:hypothetical protein